MNLSCLMKLHTDYKASFSTTLIWISLTQCWLNLINMQREYSSEGRQMYEETMLNYIVCLANKALNVWQAHRDMKHERMIHRKQDQPMIKRQDLSNRAQKRAWLVITKQCFSVRTFITAFHACMKWTANVGSRRACMNDEYGRGLWSASTDVMNAWRGSWNLTYLVM